jgi:hypothetical protein
MAGRSGPTGSGRALPVTMRRTREQVDVVVGSTNLLLVFPLLRPPPRCVRQVQLWLRLLSLDHEQANRAAYPSRLVSLATGRAGARVGLETLLDNRPRGVGLLRAGGGLRGAGLRGPHRPAGQAVQRAAAALDRDPRLLGDGIGITVREEGRCRTTAGSPWS